jgi:hypothetical protein
MAAVIANRLILRIRISPIESAQPRHAVVRAMMGDLMPEHGFGRCDGHHKMVDLKLKKRSSERAAA